MNDPRMWPASTGPVAPGGWLARFLRTPLLTKLVLADLVINAVALLAMRWTPPTYTQEITLISLAVVLVLNAALVMLALRPLAILEETTRRVSNGEFTARTHLGPFADRNLARIAATLNALLERVDADRQRLRALALEVVAAGDLERARIARELHDGTAQALSALDMLLATALAGRVDAQAGEQMKVMREIVTDALVEVRALSHTVHPRVLDDLGLPAALNQLARRLTTTSSPELVVQCATGREIPPEVASVLYRVAQESLQNVFKHGKARRVRIVLDVTDHLATLEVHDDGIGFDLAEAQQQRRGIGLFVMEERLLLVGGKLRIDTAPGTGTRVHALIPLGAEPVAPPTFGPAATPMHHDRT